MRYNLIFCMQSGEFAGVHVFAHRCPETYILPPSPSAQSAEGNVINLGVGNAVLGVPAGAMRKHRARKAYLPAAFGGRNAGDGVPYGCLS